MAEDAFGATVEVADGFSADGYRVWSSWDLRLEWQEGAKVKTTRVRVTPPWRDALAARAASEGVSLPTLVREALQQVYELPPIERYPIGAEGSAVWWTLPAWVREARKAALSKRHSKET